MSDINQDQLDQFKLITQSSDAQALQYLQMANGNLAAALQIFYAAAGSETQDTPSNQPPLTEPLVTSNPAPNPASAPSPNTQPAWPPAKRAKKTRKTGFHSLSSLGNNDEKDEKDDRQAYFGGGNSSGTSFLGKGQKPANDEDDDMVRSLFAAAKQSGAQPGQTDPSFKKPAPKKVNVFSGTSRRLGRNNENGPPPVESTATSKPVQPIERVDGQEHQAGQEPKDMIVTIIFWKQGFTVTRGPPDAKEPELIGDLRPYDHPASSEFLAQLKAQKVPPEIADPRGPPLNISVNLVQRRSDDYVPPKKVLKPFTGSGRRLGSDAPVATTTTTTTTTSTSSKNPKPQQIIVDQSKPIAKIAVRLANRPGRVQIKVNLETTIADIHNHLDSLHPQQGSYTLSVMRPPRPLTDLSQTVGEANISGTMLIQQMN